MAVAGHGITRRSFVVGSLGALAALSRSPFAFAAPSSTAQYVSRPDLTPPVLSVAKRDPGAADGYVFVAPFAGDKNGTAMIVDDAGNPVWIRQSRSLIMNFRVQQLDGRPVLTWWEGSVVDGLYEGECVILDETYEVVKRFAAGNGFLPELHEFLISPAGTALVTINNLVPADLSPYGGPVDGTLIEGVIQELDIETGEVLFEWHSLEHVGVEESSFPVGSQWDYLHLNSIDVDPADGNLVVSARYSSTVYKLDRSTGEVLWRLGGTKSDFALGPGATFWFQHDARVHPGGLLSLFDDGADGSGPPPEAVSRAIVLALDTDAMTAALVDAYPNPNGASTVAMGNTQLLAHGGAFVGWGTTPQVSELAGDGTLLFDATFPGGAYTYRAFRAQWSGRAQGLPLLAVRRATASAIDVYASWNGATRVAHWQVLGGAANDSLEPLATSPRTGFETRIRLDEVSTHLAVAALDVAGNELARSRTLVLL